MIGFDDVCNSFMRKSVTTTSIKGKKGKAATATKTRNPTLPRRSPVFLNREGDLVHKVLSCFWDPLTEVKEHYLEWILAYGFSAFSAKVKTVFDRRWNILAKYAQVTTRRLQELRKKGEEMKLLRKAQVNQQLAKRLPSERPNAVEDFYNEIIAIIPEGQLLRTVRYLTGSNPRDNTDARILLLTEIGLLYSKPDVGVINSVPSRPKEADTVSIEASEVIKVSTLLKALRLSAGETIQKLNSLFSQRSSKSMAKQMPYAARNVEELLSLVKEWQALDAVVRVVVCENQPIPTSSAKELTDRFLSWMRDNKEKLNNAIEFLFIGTSVSRSEQTLTAGLLRRILVASDAIKTALSSANF